MSHGEYYYLSIFIFIYNSIITTYNFTESLVLDFRHYTPTFRKFIQSFNQSKYFIYPFFSGSWFILCNIFSNFRYSIYS